jgi:adenylate kinase family enzyme
LKVFIIGAAGSGKTTFAQSLANALGLEMTNLDSLFWINDGKSYGVQRPEQERTTFFEEVLSRKAWIIEGAYVGWPRRAAFEADLVVFMDVEKNELRKRIFRRFFLRKIGRNTENKKETLRSLFDILIWNRTQIGKIREFVSELEKTRPICRLGNKERL